MTAASDHGDVTVVVPRTGDAYRVDLSSDHGCTSPTCAPIRPRTGAIELHSGHGDVTVRYGATRPPLVAVPAHPRDAGLSPPARRPVAPWDRESISVPSTRPPAPTASRQARGRATERAPDGSHHLRPAASVARRRPGPSSARRDLVKTYGTGDAAVHALDGVDLDFAPAPLHRDHGPVGLGQVDAHALHGRARHAHLRHGAASATSTWRASSDRELTAAAPRPRRLRVPVLQPRADAHRAREHRRCRCVLAGRKPDREWFDRVVATVGLARPPHAPPGRALGRPAAARRRRPRARRPSPRSIFADEPTGNLDSRAGAEILGFLRHAVDELGQTIVMVTHDPIAAALRRRGRVPRRRPRSSTSMPAPDHRSRARPHEGLRRLTCDRVTLKGLWSRKRRLVGMFTAVCSASRSSPARSCSATPCATASTRSSPRPTAAPTSSCAASTASTGEARPSRARSPRRSSTQVAAVDGVRARPCRSSRARVQLLGADGDRIGGNGPPTRGRTGSTPATLNPWRARRRAGAAAGRARSSSTAPPPTTGDLHVGSRPPCSCRSRCSHGRRHRHVRHRRQHGRHDVHRVHHRRGAATAPRRPRRVTGVLVAGDRRRRARQRCVTTLRPALPPDVEAITGHAAHRRAAGTTSTSAFLGFFETVLLVFAGVALLVAAFSIYNTFSIVTAQRTRESALLRALGASRRQVMIAAAMQRRCRRCRGGGHRRRRRASGSRPGSTRSWARSASACPTPASPDGHRTWPSPPRSVLRSRYRRASCPRCARRASTPLAAHAGGHDRGDGAVAGADRRGLVAPGAGSPSSSPARRWRLRHGGAGCAAHPGGRWCSSARPSARPASALLGTPSTVRARSHRVVGPAQRDAQPASTAGAATALMVGDRGGDGCSPSLAASIKASIGDVVRSDFHGDLVIVNNDRAARGSIPRWSAGSRRCPRCGTRPASGSRTQPSPGAARRSRPPTRPRWAGHRSPRRAGCPRRRRSGRRRGVIEVRRRPRARGGRPRVPVQFGNGAGADLRVGAIFDRRPDLRRRGRARSIVGGQHATARVHRCVRHRWPTACSFALGRAAVDAGRRCRARARTCRTRPSTSRA